MVDRGLGLGLGFGRGSPFRLGLGLGQKDKINRGTGRGFKIKISAYNLKKTCIFTENEQCKFVSRQIIGIIIIFESLIARIGLPASLYQ